MDEQRWEAVKRQVEAELEKARRRALVAENFDEMEAIVANMGQVIEETVLSGVAEEREPGGIPKCPSCGTPMKRKDRVARRLKTSVGKVTIERARWVCPECGDSFFPPGPEAGDSGLPPDDAAAGADGV